MLGGAERLVIFRDTLDRRPADDSLFAQPVATAKAKGASARVVLESVEKYITT